MKRFFVWLTNLSYKTKYTLFGFFFGLLFPILGTALEVIFREAAFTLDTIIHIQGEQSVLWVVDMAPLVLALTFRMAGAREDKLARVNQSLEEKIDERTAELEKSNKALEIENEERKRAQKEIMRQKEYFQALVDNSPVAVVLLDNEEKITTCNPAFENLYGYTCAEIVGKDIDTLITTGETRKEAADLTQQAMNDPVHKITKRRRKDGSLVDVELFGVPVFVENERTGALAIYHDISTLVAARKVAEESNRSKSEFLANMSHEIRTPMNGVIGMLDLALDTPLNTEQKDFLTIALQSAEALLTLLNDILDYSKIEAKKLELEIIKFDLRNTVEGVAYTLANRAEEKGLELASLVPHNMPTNLLGDPGRLRQILINLTGNAIKFTSEGEVVIRTKVVTETDTHVSVRFSVQDTGIGIPPDRIEAIFERFTQADGSTTRKFGGTGLGLAISQHLVEAMGGEMSVESEYGKGSVFSFQIEFEKQAQKESEAEVKVTNLRGLNVLIIDDNATNRAILTKMAEGFGCHADAVIGGQEGLDALNAARHAGDPYHLVLLDMQMPDMDGEQTARAIFSDPRGKNISVVILTSMGKRGDAQRLQALGCAGYLLKPIKQQMLFDALVAVVNERKTKPLGASRLITRHLVAEEKRKSERILLAEDNLVNQKVAIALLQKAGHSVDVANNGLEAFEKIQEKPYGLVLMDVQMPVMDGFEATRRIRKWEAGKRHISIVAMTAHAMKGDRERCLEAGMDDYLSKPLNRQALFSAIDRWAKPTSLAGQLPKRDTGKKEDYSIVPDTFPFEDDMPAFGKVTQADENPAPATPPPAGYKPSGATPLDIEAALPRFGNDRAFFDEMSQDLIENLPKRITEMTAALERVDSISLSRAAHNLKGMAATFSARTLTALASDLEEQSGKGDLSEAAELIQQIESESTRLNDYLTDTSAQN